MRIAVSVSADDPISELGIATLLRGQSRLRVIDSLVVDAPDVAVIALDAVTDEGLRLVQAVQLDYSAEVVLIVTRPDDAGVRAMVEAGASALLSRRDTTTVRLVAAIVGAARGEGGVPRDLMIVERRRLVARR